MNTYIAKNQNNSSHSIAASCTRVINNSSAVSQFVSNQSKRAVQNRLQTMANNSPRVKQLKLFQEHANSRQHNQQAIQLEQNDNSYSSNESSQPEKINSTGLPDNLKSGIENLSGCSMDDVTVHYNSAKPAQLQAHAYAQGTDIHVASGQEKHLPHEAWHVVQQKQGRVKPTVQMDDGVKVNDDIGLEKEADVMGAKSLQMKVKGKGHTTATARVSPSVQLVLRDPADAARNRDLTRRYHAAEDEGDAISIMSRSADDHRAAVNHYRSAIALRRNAAALHTNNDGGHLLAMDTLGDKISARSAKIREIEPRPAAARREVEDVGGPSDWFSPSSIGTASEASWLSGNSSAWEPRKKGT